jgi:hypothetical protein
MDLYRPQTTRPKCWMLTLEHHASWLMAAFWLTMRTLAVLGNPRDLQTDRYFAAIDAWFRGSVPYMDFVVPYPPGALALLALPRLFASSDQSWNYAFQILMVAIDGGIVWLLWQMLVSHSPKRELGLITAYVALTALLGGLLSHRLDVADAFCLCLWVHLMQKQSGSRWASIVLAFGVWIAPFLILVFPLHLAFIAANDKNAVKGDRVGNPFKGYISVWLKVFREIAVFVITTAALWSPFVFMAGSNVLVDSFGFSRRDLGLELESLYSFPLLLSSYLFHRNVVIANVASGHELLIAKADDLAVWGRVLVLVAGAVVGGYFIARFRSKQTSFLAEANRNLWLVQAAAAVLLVAIAVSIDFQSHDLVCVLPLALLTVQRQDSEHRRLVLELLLGFLVLTLLMLSQLTDTSMSPVVMVILAARNLALVVVTVSFIWPETIGQWTRDCLAAITVTRPKWRQALGIAPFVLLGAWVFLTCLKPCVENDTWFLLRLGRDVLYTGRVPRVDVYSAVTQGQPYVAHEWLAAVIFRLVELAANDTGLSFLPPVVTVACLVALYFAVSPLHRRSTATFCLLACVGFFFFSRAVTRPHLFTMLMQTLVVLAISRWQRRPRWRELLWLIPLHLIWCNMHGGMLFGLVLLLVVFAAVTAHVLLPLAFPGAGWEGRAPYTWHHVAQLGVTALGCAAAGFVNPNGAGLYVFAWNLFSHSAYVRQSIVEWLPFAPLQSGLLDARLIALARVGLVAGIAVRVATRIRSRELPLIDTAYASIVLYLSFGARRHVTEIAILAFPVLVRSFHEFSDWVRSQGYKGFSRPLHWELAAGITLLVFGVLEWPGIGSLGLVGNNIKEETEFIKQHGYRGIIFNEYEDGAVIINQLHPDVLPVMDSRIDIYGEKRFHEFAHASDSKETFRAYLAKYHVNLLLGGTNSNRPDIAFDTTNSTMKIISPVVLEVMSEDGWKLVYRSDKYRLYIKPKL